MIEIRGNTPKVERIRTDWYSFDRAFVNAEGDIGFPIGKGVELYGPNHCGKSTTSYSLAGIIANQKGGDIALVDLEDFDPDYLSSVLEHSGFNGVIESIFEETDEDALDKLIEMIRKNCNVAILDSIGAVQPIAEREGEIGERNMGQRAFNMAQFSRKSVYWLRVEAKKGNPRTIIATNHAYPRIGGLGKDTPGGEVKKYLFSMRVDMKRIWTKSGEVEFPDGSYVIEGRVVKNRWGIRGKKFNLFVLSGKGVDRNLTAVYDCLTLKLAQKSRVIKIGDESYGYLKDIVTQARENNDEFFQPFFDLLAKHEEEHSEVENEEDGEEPNDDNQ